MGKVTIKLYNAYVMDNIVKNLERDLGSISYHKLEELTLYAAYLMRKFAPKGERTVHATTPRLSESIETTTYVENGWEYVGEVWPTVFYAAFVNNGTGYTQGQFIPNDDLYGIEKQTTITAAYPGFIAKKRKGGNPMVGTTRGQAPARFMERTLYELYDRYADKALDEMVEELTRSLF